jgi:hypothetical protein
MGWKLPPIEATGQEIKTDLNLAKSAEQTQTALNYVSPPKSSSGATKGVRPTKIRLGIKYIS